jgi:hypothetical protein
MPTNSKNQKDDYKSLGSSKRNDDKNRSDLKTLKPRHKREKKEEDSVDRKIEGLVNFNRDQHKKISPHHQEQILEKADEAEKITLQPRKAAGLEKKVSRLPEDGPEQDRRPDNYAGPVKSQKREKRK